MIICLDHSWHHKVQPLTTRKTQYQRANILTQSPHLQPAIKFNLSSTSFELCVKLYSISTVFRCLNFGNPMLCIAHLPSYTYMLPCLLMSLVYELISTIDTYLS